ncbi:hypothetical protein JCM5350_000971 [Sporobolomyces pararoseus]
MDDEPDYNRDNPPTLYRPGVLGGRAVDLDTSSIRPLGNRVGLFSGERRERDADEARQVVAIKVVPEDSTRAPRNGRREAELLSRLSHPNIISLLNSYLQPPSPSSLGSRITLFFPFYPHTLRKLLDSPAFIPDTLSSSSFSSFSAFSHVIAKQLISATSYLHSCSISHRDINPSNVVISDEGQVKLIDFGIAVKDGDEKAGEQCFEVGTGPYRAPELVFAAKTYDPFAIDLWALAATIAEMFRPFTSPDPPSPSSQEDEYDDPRFSWMKASSTPFLPTRQCLFESGSSDFVLAASIFKIVGTPTLETWPEARHLPNFTRFSFASFPPPDLACHLPHLEPTSRLLDILQSMLVCSAAKRMSASSAEKRLKELGIDESQNMRQYLEHLMEGQSVEGVSSQ